MSVNNYLKHLYDSSDASETMMTRICRPIIDTFEGSFIAGGFFKDVLGGRKGIASDKNWKDIDLFFYTERDFLNACEKIQTLDRYKKVYNNNNCVAYFYDNSGVRFPKNPDLPNGFNVELIAHCFGTPEQVLSNFDFTVTKCAIYKDGNAYSFIEHRQFREDLETRRLRIDLTAENIDFNTLPERIARYMHYNFVPVETMHEDFVEIINKSGKLPFIDPAKVDSPFYSKCLPEKMDFKYIKTRIDSGSFNHRMISRIVKYGVTSAAYDYKEKYFDDTNIIFEIVAEIFGKEDVCLLNLKNNLIGEPCNFVQNSLIEKVAAHRHLMDKERLMVVLVVLCFDGLVSFAPFKEDADLVLTALESQKDEDFGIVLDFFYELMANYQGGVYPTPTEWYDTIESGAFSPVLGPSIMMNMMIDTDSTEERRRNSDIKFILEDYLSFFKLNQDFSESYFDLFSTDTDIFAC